MSVNRQLKADWRVYYWLCGELNGKPSISGRYKSYEDADMDGHLNYDNHGGQHKVYMLHTRDRAEASRIIRKDRLDMTHDLESAFQRFKQYEKDTEVNS